MEGPADGDLMLTVVSRDPNTTSCTGEQEEGFKAPLDFSHNVVILEEQGVEIVEEAKRQQVQEVSTEISFGFSQGKVGGSLRLFQDEWKRITRDSWVLKTVQGFEREFVRIAEQTIEPKELHLSQEKMELEDKEMDAMLQKGAIRMVEERMRGYVSTLLFLVEKDDKGWRPVINLRGLNQNLVYKHFKMEGIHLLRDILQKGDWMMKLDLKGRVFYNSNEGGELFAVQMERQIIPICLPPFQPLAPWWFTKVMRVVMAYLRERGFRLIVYLDDILIMSQDTEVLKIQLQDTIRLLEKLGFLFNREKSVLIASQSMEFLGFKIDSIEEILK